MKTLHFAAGMLVAASLLLAGCGKSDEIKKLEASLNTEVMQRHDDLMKAMSGLDAAGEELRTALSKHDSLAKLFPKEFAGQETTDLVAAKEKLEAAKASMMTWMKGFKPYDPLAKHEEVMSLLKKTITDLGVVEHQFQEARTAATEAVAAHAKATDELAAKLPKKKK